MIPKLLPEPLWVSLGVSFSRVDCTTCVWTLLGPEYGAGCESWVCWLECPHECVQGFSHCRVELKLGKRGVKLLAGGLWLHRFDEWAGISNPLVGSHLKQSSHLGCEAQYFEKLGLVGPCVLPGLHAQQQALMLCGYEWRTDSGWLFSPDMPREPLLVMAAIIVISWTTNFFIFL